MNTKNNILLAEFLGLKIITDGISYFDTNYKALKSYDTDWNWLMYVVEKIESLNIVDDLLIARHYVEIICVPEYENRVMVKNHSSKIEAVYKACIEFVKWFNQQNNEK
jgi:hypothetical protein